MPVVFSSSHSFIHSVSKSILSPYQLQDLMTDARASMIKIDMMTSGPR